MRVIALISGSKVVQVVQVEHPEPLYHLKKCPKLLIFPQKPRALHRRVR